MSEQAFKSVASYLTAIEAKDVKTPEMPVSEYAQEGEDLANWATTDRVALQKAGLNVTLIDDTPIRANALRYLQGVWLADTEGRKNALVEWKTTSPIGFDLVAQLQHSLRFAFRKNPDLLARLDEIAQDAGNADMVQDLMSLSVLGKNHKPLLKEVAFDTALLDQAAQLSATLGNLLALNNGAQEQNSEAKLLRDKAYIYLKQAVDEIRQYGKYVFWRNPERLSGYASDYLRTKNEKVPSKSKTVVSDFY